MADIPDSLKKRKFDEMNNRIQDILEHYIEEVDANEDLEGATGAERQAYIDGYENGLTGREIHSRRVSGKIVILDNQEEFFDEGLQDGTERRQNPRNKADREMLELLGMDLHLPRPRPSPHRGLIPETRESKNEREEQARQRERERQTKNSEWVENVLENLDAPTQAELDGTGKSGGSVNTDEAYLIALEHLARLTNEADELGIIGQDIIDYVNQLLQDPSIQVTVSEINQVIAMLQERIEQVIPPLPSMSVFSGYGRNRFRPPREF